MNKHDATEQAYKNGYEQGKIAAVKEMQERLLKEFPHHNGKVFGAIGADTVNWVVKKMLEGE